MERWLEDGDAAGLAMRATRRAWRSHGGRQQQEEVVVAVATTMDSAGVDWEEEVLTAAAGDG